MDEHTRRSIKILNNCNRFYGFHPKSCGFKYKMPARDTVAGVAVRKLEISKISRIEGVKAIRSLLANVKT